MVLVFTPLTASNYSPKLPLASRHEHGGKHLLASELFWEESTNFSGAGLEREIGNLFLLMVIKSIGNQLAGPTCESVTIALPVGGKSLFPALIKKISGHRIR